MYCHRYLLAEEMRKSYLGLAALPSRDSSHVASADHESEDGTALGAPNLVPFGTAIDIRPSVAMRRVSARKRGSMIARVPDPFRKREIQVESELEYDFAHVLIARADVVEIREQQRPQVPRGSKSGRYHVDFVATQADGWKVAYEVKYADEVTEETKERLRVLARESGRRFADEFRTLTEKDLSEVAIENAKVVVDCGRDADFEAQRAVRQATVGRAGDITSARAIGALTGLGRRGERAAFALIQSGLLRPRKGAPLDQNTALTIRKDPRLA